MIIHCKYTDDQFDDDEFIDFDDDVDAAASGDGDDDVSLQQVLADQHEAGTHFCCVCRATMLLFF